MYPFLHICSWSQHSCVYVFACLHVCVRALAAPDFSVPRPMHPYQQAAEDCCQRRRHSAQLPKHAHAQLHVLPPRGRLRTPPFHVALPHSASSCAQDKFELKFNGNITVVNQVQSLYQEISEFVSCRNSTVDSERYASPDPNPCYPRPTADT